MNLRLLFLLLFPLSLSAQVKMQNTSSTNPERNILYTNGINDFKISGLENYRDLRVTDAMESKIRFIDSNTFRLFQNQEKDTTDTIRLYQGEKLILTTIYTVQSSFYKSSFVQLANISRTFTSVAEILADPKLNLIPYNCSEVDLKKAQVISFELILVVDPKTIFQAKISGSALRPAQIAEIKKLKPGSKIYVESIRIKDSDGVPRYLNSINNIIIR